MSTAIKKMDPNMGLNSNISNCFFSLKSLLRCQKWEYSNNAPSSGNKIGEMKFLITN